MDDYPAVVLGSVLRDLLAGELHGLLVVAFTVHGGEACMFKLCSRKVLVFQCSIAVLYSPSVPLLRWWYRRRRVMEIQKLGKEEQQDNLQQPRKKHKYKKQTASLSLSQIQPLQPPAHANPSTFVKGRGCHALRPSLPRSLYLHIRGYCPMSSLVFITDPFERSGVAADERVQFAEAN